MKEAGPDRDHVDDYVTPNIVRTSMQKNNVFLGSNFLIHICAFIVYEYWILEYLLQRTLGKLGV